MHRKRLIMNIKHIVIIKYCVYQWIGTKMEPELYFNNLTTATVKKKKKTLFRFQPLDKRFFLRTVNVIEPALFFWRTGTETEPFTANISGADYFSLVTN